MEQIKKVIDDMGIRFRLDLAYCNKFEEQDKRLYALEENRKLKDASIKQLESRYSEMLMVLKDINRKLSGRHD